MVDGIQSSVVIAMKYLIVTILLALATYFMLLHVGVTFSGQPITIGQRFLFIVYIGFYGLGKLYCLEWENIISGKKIGIGLFLYEKLLFPTALLYLLKGKAPLMSIVSQPYLLAPVALLFILLSDWAGIIKNTIRHWYPRVSDLEKKKLFLKFPPTSRIDMLPFDFWFNGAMMYFIYREVFN